MLMRAAKESQRRVSRRGARPDRSLEISDLVAPDEANLPQRGELLLRFEGRAKLQKKLPQMGTSPTMARIEHQRALIVPHGRTELSTLRVRVTNVGLDVRIGRIAQDCEIECLDGCAPVLRRKRSLSGREVGIKLCPVGL